MINLLTRNFLLARIQRAEPFLQLAQGISPSPAGGALDTNLTLPQRYIHLRCFSTGVFVNQHNKPPRGREQFITNLCIYRMELFVCGVAEPSRKRQYLCDRHGRTKLGSSSPASQKGETLAFKEQGHVRQIPDNNPLGVFSPQNGRYLRLRNAGSLGGRVIVTCWDDGTGLSSRGEGIRSSGNGITRGQWWYSASCTYTPTCSMANRVLSILVPISTG